MKAAHQRAPARIWVITVSTLLLAFRAVAEREALRGDATYIVLPETKAPDGRFGVALSIPKHPDIFAKARDATTEQADSLISDIGVIEDDVVNQVVDLQTGKVLAQLTTRYWEVGELRPNRHHLEVVWSRENDVVLANHTFRWDCRAFDAARIGDGATGKVLDLKKALEGAAWRFFSKDFPRGAHFSKRDLGISFSDVTLLADGSGKATVEAVFPSKPENAWSGEAVARFALGRVGAAGLFLKGVRITATDSR